MLRQAGFSESSDEVNQDAGMRRGRLPKAALKGRHRFAGAKCRQRSEVDEHSVALGPRLSAFDGRLCHAGMSILH